MIIRFLIINAKKWLQNGKRSRSMRHNGDNLADDPHLYVFIVHIYIYTYIYIYIYTHTHTHTHNVLRHYEFRLTILLLSWVRVSAACNLLLRVPAHHHRRRSLSLAPDRTDWSDRYRLSNLQIRVVNAFRQGLDTRYGEHSTTSLAEVLRKQSSLSKRLSQTSSIEYADNIPDELTIPEIDVERLSSHSHTETAV